jgi:membrane protein DedA with SNARE-associated domain
MVYYRRPKFWFALAIAELAAFVIAGLVSIAGWVCLRWFGVPSNEAGRFVDPIGLLAFMVLGYIAFRWTRWDYRERRAPQGFPVITQTNE